MNLCNVKQIIMRPSPLVVAMDLKRSCRKILRYRCPKVFLSAIALAATVIFWL